jgi:hypothetical protein
VRRGLDDGTERLRGQLRDTTQHGQRDDYGGDWIEDAAAAGGHRAEQAAEKLLKGKKHGRTATRGEQPVAERAVSELPAETDPQAPQARSTRPAEHPRIKIREAVAQRDAAHDGSPVSRAEGPAGTIQRSAARPEVPAAQDTGTPSQEQGRSLVVRQAEKRRLQANAQNMNRSGPFVSARPVYADPGYRVGGLSDRAAQTTIREQSGHMKASVKTARAGTKTVGRASRRTVKTAEQTAQRAVNSAGRTAQMAKNAAITTARATQRAAQAARVTARTAVVTAKAAGKAAVAAGKAAAAGIKSLVAAIMAGGWVAVVIVILICLIGLLAASPFGIFFAEDEAASGSVTPSAAVAQINGELADHLTSLWMSGAYNRMEVTGQTPAWSDVLAVFAVKTTESGGGMSVAVLDAQRVDLLRTVFWEMTKITTEEKEVQHPAVGEAPAWTEKVLSITITPRTPDDMRVFYSFTTQQSTTLDELLASGAMLASLAGDLTITSQEAKTLLTNLPDELSPERRAVVETACRLVGKINYFWGGKSLVLGWDNRWGTIQKVWADGSPSTGTWRPYGLDCSGLVDWVFYNVTGGGYIIGHGGGAMMQHTYCTDIGWDEAQPGDLVLYPADEHVGIVGGRDENGDLLVIHCASSHNNVVITGADGFTAIARPDFYVQ